MYSCFRQERTGDREHIQVFHQYNGTPEEEAESLKLYKKVCSTFKIPIGFTINYGKVVLTEGNTLRTLIYGFLM